VAEPVLRQVLATGAPVVGIELTGETSAAPGVVRTWIESWYPLRNTSGAIVGVNIVAEEITERRRAEVAQRASDARYRALVEAAPLVAWSSRLDGTIDMVNQRWSDFTGEPATTFAGQHWNVIVHPDDREHVAALRDRAIATNEGFEVEARFGHGDGSYRWHLARVVPVTDATGTVLAWHGAAVDIHDRRREAAELARTVAELRDANRRLERLTADLQAANDDLATAHLEASTARVMAEQASAAKTQFLATMSHELRTPLNAVLGYVELIDLEIVGPLTPGQRGYLARVTTSARHLLGLINEVLDLSRVESGQMTVTPRPMALGTEAEAAVTLVRPQAEAKALAVATRVPAGDVRVVADPDRVRQILVNLLGNAVKFTERGGRVALRVDVEREHVPPSLTGAGPWARVAVEDTGIGIPPDRLEAVFEPFVQVDGETASSVYARRHAGTGLGLAIARRLARLMGGDLTVVSALGVGSTFTLWLPVALAPRAALSTPVAGQEPVHGRRATRLELGRVLTEHAPDVTNALVERLRADPACRAACGAARGAARVDLEDHLTAFLADLGQALTILDAPDGDRVRLVADGAARQHGLVTRHGRQRRRLGWPDAMLRREFEMLREEVARAIRGASRGAGAPPLDELLDLVDALLAEAERDSLQAFAEGDAAG